MVARLRHPISARNMIFSLQMAETAGVSCERVCRDALPGWEGLRHGDFVEYHALCDVLDRFADEVGGLDGLADAFERGFAANGMVRGFLGLVSHIVDPRSLYYLINVMANKANEPTVRLEQINDVDGPGYQLVTRLEPPLRLSFAFASLGAMRAQPTLLGLPRAAVEMKIDEDDRGYRYLVAVPESHGVARQVTTAGRRRLSSGLREMEAFARELRRAIHPEAAANPFADHLDRIARRWELTPRQRDVLERVARGKSNKEIAFELENAEATIEVHVTAILRKAKVTGRTELIVRVWEGFSHFGVRHLER